MGAIASVLQWHCNNCSLINPTEQLKCIRCGTSRQIYHNKDELNRKIKSDEINSFATSKNCTVIKRLKSTITEQSINR